MQHDAEREDQLARGEDPWAPPDRVEDDPPLPGVDALKLDIDEKTRR